MSLDAEAQEYLDLMKDRPSVTSLSPEQARAASKAARAMVVRSVEPVRQIEDTQIPTTDGQMDVRIYTPDSGRELLPALVYLHGGGWVVGDIDGTDPLVRQLANRSGAKIVSCDYRLAPEHRFPRAVLDAVEAYAWVIDNAAVLGVDPDRIGIAGDSSGGNVAAAACVMLRDTGAGNPKMQLLIYPVTYCGLSASDYDREYDMVLLSGDAMAWFSEQYLNDPSEADNPWASPLKAKDLSGLPPAVIVSTGTDVLRSQIEQYRDRLVEAGVPVEFLHFEGMFHGFFGLGGILEGATVAMDATAPFVRSMLEA